MLVAVGMWITPHPPHGSGLEELPHPALAAGPDAYEGSPPPAFSRTGSSSFGAPFPVLCPERVFLVPVPFGQTPSLHPLHRHRSGLVRELLRYYGSVRLPGFVHHRLLSLDFPMRPLWGEPGISRFPCITRPYVPGSSTSRDRNASRLSASDCCLPHIAKASASRSRNFAAP